MDANSRPFADFVAVTFVTVGLFASLIWSSILAALVVRALAKALGGL